MADARNRRPSAQSLFDGCLGDIGWGLEHAEPDRGELDAVVEADAGLAGRHGSFLWDLTLAYERVEMAADTGLAIVTYSAEPGSPSEERLRELREWSSTRARLAVIDAPDARLP